MPQGQGAPVTVTNQPGGIVSDPVFNRSVGGATIATGQVADSISPAAAIQIVAARAGRQSVIITNVTGTQPVYLGNSGVLVGTGLFLAGTVGASITIATGAAIFATSPTAAQTLSFLENY